MYIIINTAIIALQFIAVFSLLSMVCITNPELSAGETIGQWVWFWKTVPFSVGCIVTACLLQLLRKDPLKNVLLFPYFLVYVVWGLILLGAIEVVWGVGQLYGLADSRHSRYVITGSFFNPGPFAGYLAMVLPLCFHLYLRYSGWKYLDLLHKMEKIAASTVGILILCILPATMSRSAWVAAALSCAWVWYMHRDKRKWKIILRRYRKRCFVWCVGMLLTLLLVTVAIFYLKPYSALGRLFMWKITSMAIANHPWGCQAGFAFAYGEAQSLYFISGTHAAWEERVAGSPEYAFNEYLELALVHGLAICLLVLLVIGVCFRRGVRLERFGACGAIISLLVFSFSSYPMHLPGFIIAGVCLLFACGPGDIIGKLVIVFVGFMLWSGGYGERWQNEEDACRRWMNARIIYRSGAYEPANKAYNELYPYLKERDDFLFEYGHCLHKSEHYEESNIYLEKALQYCNDPMILNIMGKNCQAMGDYKSAETFFLQSTARLPGRIYPYYLLARLYADPEYQNKEKFNEMKWYVMNRKPKVHSTAIEEMRKELMEVAMRWDNESKTEY